MNYPVKVEVFSGADLLTPYITKQYNHIRVCEQKSKGFYSECIETIQHDFGSYKDFPSGERLVEIFIKNKQRVFEKLYLDENGDIITAIKFTLLEK